MEQPLYQGTKGSDEKAVGWNAVWFLQRVNTAMNDTKQWLIVVLVPLAVAIVVLGSGVVLLPLGGTLGILVGLFSSAAFFTVGFKVGLALGLLTCCLSFLIGYRFRNRFLGKTLMSLSVFVWCGIGLFGFGPQ